jgi:small subunit ribosomal protein S6
LPSRAAYDLFVLTDPAVDDDRRAAIVQRVREQVESGDGAVKGDADWGLRKLAYEIEHKPEAHYHLFQIEATPEVVRALEHMLSIDDAVVRHRVIRLPKGVPDQTPGPPAAYAGPPPGAREDGERPRGPRRSEQAG